jgi:uncharacterized protein (TIGR00645 family)
MAKHFKQLEETETRSCWGCSALIDVTMVANLLTMVIIGGYATFVSKLDLETHPDRPGVAHPCGPRDHQNQTGRVAGRHLQHSSV